MFAGNLSFFRAPTGQHDFWPGYSCSTFSLRQKKAKRGWKAIIVIEFIFVLWCVAASGVMRNFYYTRNILPASPTRLAGCLFFTLLGTGENKWGKNSFVSRRKRSWNLCRPKFYRCFLLMRNGRFIVISSPYYPVRSPILLSSTVSAIVKYSIILFK